MRLVLASTSPFRRELLARAGFSFEGIAPGVDETAPPGATPEGLALALGEAKARAVAAKVPDAIVVGADQVCDLDGACLGKPADAAAARAQLASLRGRSHRLVTGLCVIAPARAPILRLETTTLLVRAITDEELDRYVATDEWQGCAGGYRVEGGGGALLERIDGDFFNVIGLPLFPLVTILRELGVPLWAPPR